MTAHQIANGFEKSPMASKKFVAYLLSQLSWTGLMGAILVIEVLTQVEHDQWLLLSMVVAQAFLQTGFILGQAGLDMFVRCAAVLRSGTSDAIKDVQPPRVQVVQADARCPMIEELAGEIEDKAAETLQSESVETYEIDRG